MDDALAKLKRALVEMQIRATVPYRRALFWDASVRRGARDIAAWDALISSFADEALHEGSRVIAAEGATSIIRALRNACMPDGTPVPRELVIAEVSTFFFVGTDTTGHTLAWTLLLLTQHPDCKRRVVEELEAAGLKVRVGVQELVAAQGTQYTQQARLGAQRAVSPSPSRCTAGGAPDWGSRARQAGSPRRCRCRAPLVAGPLALRWRRPPRLRIQSQGCPRPAAAAP